MVKKSGNSKIEKKKNNDADLVTKESLCAVCALFSLLAFLILCTGQWVFGDIGLAVRSFLVGVFGYLAFPALIFAAYCSIFGLIGKRVFKNKLAAFCIILAILCAALVVHTALTLQWPLDTYFTACFKAGETFPISTVLGCFGSLIIFPIASATTKVGVIVIFSILALFLTYLSAVLFKKTVKKEARKENTATQQSTVATEIPLTLPTEVKTQPAYSQPPMKQQEIAPTVNTAQPTREYYDNVDVPQRPAFSILEGGQAQTPSNGSSFSPFGTPQSGQTENTISDYERSREFLFGATPQEIYQKNLIFDPNSRVNRRPPYTPSVTSGYTPSYTDAYQNALNETPARPTKIFNDESYDNEVKNASSYEEEITPLQPFEPSRVQPQEIPSYQPIEPVREEPVYTAPIETTREVEEREIIDDAPRRHDYMDLFSPSNPNIFGDSQEDREIADATFSRGEDSLSRGEEFLRDGSSRRGFEEDLFEDTAPSRGRMDIFDEEDDDPYSLRDSFEEELPVRGLENDRFMEEPSSRIMESERFMEEPVTPPVIRQEDVKPTPPPPPKPRIIRPYVRVPIDDFDCRDVEPLQNQEEVEETKANIIATLEDFKVTGAAIASVTFGPTVTRYNVTIPRNISPKKVVALDQPIAISLHSSGVNIYPNYEDGVVSIEVPNKERQFVNLGCMLTGDTFVNAKSSSLMFTMGKDVGNRKVYGDISKMIHLLVAGSSGSGKSVFLGSLIISLIYKYSPEELRLILIDPKKTEFVLYNDLPHLMINEIITDANKAVQSLNWAIGEMNRRYGLFEQMSRAGTYVVNLDQYNAHVEKTEKLPKIVIIIDELADLMLAAKKDVEDRIQNLTQKARAAGIHLVVATQRPSTDVITGVIKSNLNTRIAFAVATDVDSRVILDQTGAQKLLGKGDFLYTMQGINTPIRVQSAFISAEDSQRVVNFIKANNEAYYDESATAYINNVRGSGDGNGGFGGGDEVEPVYIDALRYVILSNSASISLIQRKCSIGYNKAGKIVEWMEEMGYISSFDGAKARKVLISKEEFESKYGSL